MTGGAISNGVSRITQTHMSQDIEHYVQQCAECQEGKGTKNHKIGKLQQIKSSHPGEIVHFDFAGPFFKKLHILIMVDNYSGCGYVTSMLFRVV